MKKKVLLFFGFILSILFVSCDLFDQYNTYKLDGMWQLKTVQDVAGNVVDVDTVYYGFQRGVVFSFTVLQDPNWAFIAYGYVEKLSDDKVHIKIDRKWADNYYDWKDDENKVLNYVDDFSNFLSDISGWSSANVVFDIKEYNHSKLVLFDAGNEKTYTFKKF